MNNIFAAFSSSSLVLSFFGIFSKHANSVAHTSSSVCRDLCSSAWLVISMNTGVFRPCGGSLVSHWVPSTVSSPGLLGRSQRRQIFSSLSHSVFGIFNCAFGISHWILGWLCSPAIVSQIDVDSDESYHVLLLLRQLLLSSTNDDRHWSCVVCFWRWTTSEREAPPSLATSPTSPTLCDSYSSIHF